MCSKRDEVHQQIVLVEDEKQKIQNDIRILTDRLAQVNESLAKKIVTRNDYDKTIAECETAYRKVSHVHRRIIIWLSFQFQLAKTLFDVST